VVGCPGLRGIWWAQEERRDGPFGGLLVYRGIGLGNDGTGGVSATRPKAVRGIEGDRDVFIPQGTNRETGSTIGIYHGKFSLKSIIGIKRAL